MNLYRVTRTDINGQHPYHTLHQDRQQAQNEYDYLIHHTFYQATITGYWCDANPDLLHHFLSE